MGSTFFVLNERFLNDRSKKIDLGSTDLWFVLLIFASLERKFWNHASLFESVFNFERISCNYIIKIIKERKIIFLSNNLTNHWDDSRFLTNLDEWTNSLFMNWLICVFTRIWQYKVNFVTVISNIIGHWIYWGIFLRTYNFYDGIQKWQHIFCLQNIRTFYELIQNMKI